MWSGTICVPVADCGCIEGNIYIPVIIFKSLNYTGASLTAFLIG